MWIWMPLLFTLLQAPQAQAPGPVEGDFVLRNFRFTSGETLPELRMHYRTYGTPRKDAQGVVRNAVLVMHGTGGTGGQFTGRNFAGELFGPGQPLDAAQYYIILPDDIGHGRSSKPSDGVRAKFPRYGYVDMVEAEYRLVTEGLGVNHLRLVMGTSMGGMHTWMWGSRYPDFMDALMPLASLPTQISGRNRAWRRVLIDAIRHDPEWKNGEYTTQPQSLRTAALMLWLVGSNPILRQKAAPTIADTDRVLDQYVANYVKTGDANDILYAIEASRDYDPGPGLEKIEAPLLAVNSADDLINPPELQILEREIKRVPKGRAVVLPLSDRTAGHGTHTQAALWKHLLVELLKESERGQSPPPQARPAYRSRIVIHDLKTNASRVVHEADGIWEAPNWSRDGRFLLVNSGGRLYRIRVGGAAAPEALPLDPDLRANNDHDFSADGKRLAISASSSKSKQSQIYVAAADATKAQLIVSAAPSYFHGWSPDGVYLAFVANRDGKQYDLYRVPAAGGEEQRLTSDPAADDGPDYSPDGKWIYFNSNRGGGWNIWRMPAGGAGPGDARAERVTDDPLEDWFPHPSPDGKQLLFLSFPAGTVGHNDRAVQVQLRVIPMPGDSVTIGKARTLATVTGGQGTINVNSWAPDSTKFAYVTYELVAPKQ